jgi:hypothetical protein
VRKLHKSKRKVKMATGLGKLGMNFAKDPLHTPHNQIGHEPPPPTPVLSQLLTRIEDCNGNMRAKISVFIQMNDRLLGSVPAEADQKIDTGGGIVAQLEQQILQYEHLVNMFGSQLERLSIV